jgi:hypothetical protein
MTPNVKMMRIVLLRTHINSVEGIDDMHMQRYAF